MDDYQRLDEAGADQKAAIVMDHIGRRPDGQLALPAQADRRASLAGADLSAERLTQQGETICLDGANLQGANLRGADLRGLSLREADLQGATLGGADLREAVLENANLSGADLVSARLEGIQAGGANLSEALLEDAHLQRAHLRFARLPRAALDQANLHEADLWGTNLEGASLQGADLREALLHEANIQNANLAQADLRGADLREANLREAILREADLRGAELEGAVLERAVLQRARLEGLSLIDCQLGNVHLSEARLEGTRLERRQLGEAIGEEHSREYEAASYGYLSLEQNFGNLGDPDAARWAYIKKRTMQKLAARRATRRALYTRDWRTAAQKGFSYAQARLVEIVCGYGESISRILGSIFAVYVIFTLLYGLTGSVVRDGEVVQLWPLADLGDLATFGLITMTAPEGPQVGLHPNGDLAHLFTSLQTLLTIGLTGLLGFVLGNRIHR